MIDLGVECDRAILKAAGVDPDQVQPGSLTIDMVPTTGPATIRFTTVRTLDSGVLRGLIATAAAAQPVTSSSPVTVTTAIKL